MSYSRILTNEELTQDLFSLVQNNIKTTSVPEPLTLRGAYDQTVAKIFETERIIRENKFFPFQNGKEVYEQLLPGLRTQAEHLKMARFGYTHRVDISFLSWIRKSNCLPVFIVLDLHDKFGFNISVRGKESWGAGYEALFHPENLPQVIKDQYRSTIRLLESRAEENGSLEASISASYSGLMPEKTEKIITTADRSKLFQRIYVIVEGPEDWKITIKGDPLVIGQTDKDFYLITVYDPTALEKCVAEEYTFPLT